jgi:hypothetical protein
MHVVGHQAVSIKEERKSPLFDVCCPVENRKIEGLTPV